MGVSCAQVSKILNGKENLGLQTICKLEKALKRKIISFMGEEDANTNSSVSVLTPVFPLSVEYADTYSLSATPLQQCMEPDNISYTSIKS